MASKDTSVVLTLNPEITEAAYGVLKQYPDKINGFAKMLLEAYAGGGIMLTGIDLQAIEKTAGVKITDSSTVISSIQKSASREDGQFTVKAQIDPSFWPNITDMATQQGTTVPALLEDAINTMLSNSWLYSWIPAMQTNWSDKELYALKGIIGKDRPTAADIISALRSTRKVAQAA